MTTPDPDWFTPHTDDYAATYGADDGDPAEEYAEADTTIRYAIERGRPGYTHPDDTE